MFPQTITACPSREPAWGAARRGLALAVLFGGLAAPPAGAASLSPAPLSITARSPDGTVLATPVFVRLGETLEVTAVVSPGDAPIAWFVAEPIADDYDDTQGDAMLRYRWAPLSALSGRARFQLSESPELRAVGTHRLLAVRGTPAAAPTMAQVAHLFELVVRRDDSYPGYASELTGVPFVFYPRSAAGLGHMTDQRLGADCVALVIYGQRRLGRRVPYVSPAKLRDFLEPLARADALQSHLANPDLPAEVGAVLHFGFQTAMLSVDTAPLGLLNGSDRVLHTFRGFAEERRVDELPYRDFPLTLYRWPAPRPSPPSRHPNR